MGSLTPISRPSLAVDAQSQVDAVLMSHMSPPKSSPVTHTHPTVIPGHNVLMADMRGGLVVGPGRRGEIALLLALGAVVDGSCSHLHELQALCRPRCGLDEDRRREMALLLAAAIDDAHSCSHLYHEQALCRPRRGLVDEDRRRACDPACGPAESRQGGPSCTPARRTSPRPH